MIADVTRRVDGRGGSWRLAQVLIYLTVAWNLVEGIVAVVAGVRASSVALVGFGLDSFIEITASAVLVWRMAQPNDARTEQRERLARRVVGATFILLAIYIVLQAAYLVVAGHAAEASGIGLALAGASLTVMPAIGLLKRRNAQRLHSHSLMAEAAETLVCSYLSAALVLGLALNAALGWGWADTAAALAMLPWIVKEGVEGLRAEDCETCD
jgi:divalent metal cation (Fe/Co/Zn/Cd) transporter